MKKKKLKLGLNKKVISKINLENISGGGPTYRYTIPWYPHQNSRGCCPEQATYYRCPTGGGTGPVSDREDM